MAVRELLVPTLHEREQFCRTPEWDRCPTYQALLDRGGPVSQEVYYSLWIPPAMGRAAGRAPAALPANGSVKTVAS
jgi:hypothetical protein